MVFVVAQNTGAQRTPAGDVMLTSSGHCEVDTTLNSRVLTKCQVWLSQTGRDGDLGERKRRSDVSAWKRAEGRWKWAL